MVLPFEPMTMTFKDLHYWVQIPKVCPPLFLFPLQASSSSAQVKHRDFDITSRDFSCPDETPLIIPSPLSYFSIDIVVVTVFRCNAIAITPELVLWHGCQKCLCSTHGTPFTHMGVEGQCP